VVHAKYKARGARWGIAAKEVLMLAPEGATTKGKRGGAGGGDRTDTGKEGAPQPTNRYGTMIELAYVYAHTEVGRPTTDSEQLVLNCVP
jgi:hypothetical protein